MNKTTGKDLKTMKAVSAALIAFFLLASVSVIIKLELQKGAAIEWIVVVQYFTGLLITTLIASRNNFKDLKTKKVKYHIIRGVTGVIAFCMFSLAISKIPLVNATLLNNSTPLFIPIISLIWLGILANKKIWIGIITGFVGIIFILDPSSESFIKSGDLFGLASGISLAISYVALGVLTKTDSFLSILFYYCFISVVIFLPLAILRWSSPELIVWIYGITGGIFFVTYLYLLQYAYRLIPAVKLAPVNFSVVVFTGLLDWLIFDQIPGMLSFIGIILVITGGIFSILMHEKDNDKLKHHWY